MQRRPPCHLRQIAWVIRASAMGGGAPKPVHRGRHSSIWRILLLVAALPALADVARADGEGVRHRIDASVGVAQTSPLLGALELQQTGEASGSVSFSVRVSANSNESRFFGVLAPAFDGLRLSASKTALVDPVRIWEEDRCHQRRGLPKVTITQLRGAFRNGERRREVLSEMRHIGVRISDDELLTGIKMPAGFDSIGRYYAVRAKSTVTEVYVDLKIYVLPCSPSGMTPTPS